MRRICHLHSHILILAKGEIVPRKKKPPKTDKDTQKYLFGRIRTDRVRERVVQARQDKAADKRTQRALDSLIRHRDRHYPGSEDWKRADAAVEKFRRDHRL
jgi:hypothetical protein